MENNQQEYLGYIIRKSQDPWMYRFNMPFEYFHPDGEGRIYGAGSVQDAKDEIDERLTTWQENYNKQNKAKIL